MAFPIGELDCFLACAQIMDDRDGSNLCRQLAHLYYYYLHGSSSLTTPGTVQGSREEQSGVPSILVECWCHGKLAWKRLLNDIDDDLESLHHRTKQSELDFVLDVPGAKSTSIRAS